MTIIWFKDEGEFFETFKDSERYNYFKVILSDSKKRKEEEAWNWIQTIPKTDDAKVRRILDDVIRLVDCHYHDSHGGWYGLAFREANMDKIKQSNSTEKLMTYFDTLTKHEPDIEKEYQRFNECLNEPKKVKGAKTGLPSLILYLKRPTEFNVWLPVNQRALHILDLEKYSDKINRPYASYYKIFNDKIKTIRIYGFSPQDIDWILTFIERYLKREGNQLYIYEEELNKREIQLRN
jgi:hypothetical protein